MILARAGLAGLMLALAPAAANAQTPAAIGNWEREDGTSRIRVAPCGANLCGTVTWTNAPRRDERNPDPALRARSTVGIAVFTGMRPNGDNRWSGSAYNTEDGQTYSGNMSVNGNTLVTQGCVMGGLICRSVNWRRI